MMLHEMDPGKVKKMAKPRVSLIFYLGQTIYYQKASEMNKHLHFRSYSIQAGVISHYKDP